MTTRSADERLSPPSPVRIGDVLAGKYRIERVLGRGGMGVVVAASHVKLRQTVAIKFLLPSAFGEPRLATRLLREARAAAALRGEHVVRVFDVDAVEGAPYIVMEYLEGRTLAALLETEGPLSPTLAVDFAVEACEALAEAHALGIVHRDLKPSNLFVARTPGGRQTLRVLDFGISKAFGEEHGGRAADAASADPAHTDVSTFSGTDSHALVGSPPYISPEQLLRPREADARSDIWSLGVVLYQCLSGRLPFQGETLTRLWDSILREPLPELPTTEPPIPAELERVVRRCLEKDSAGRYAGVPELARALAPLGSARARASLEVIEGLASSELPARRAAEGAKEAVLVDPDGTFTEAPTTREPTPDGTAVMGRDPSRRQRAWTLAVAGAAFAGISFLALRAERRVEAPTPLVGAVSAATVRQESTARTAEVTKAPPVATVRLEDARPSPPPSSSGARMPPVRRERVAAPEPSAAASSPPELPPVDVLARAESLLGKGQISEACAVGQVAAAATPESPRVLEFLGRCYMRLGSLDQARAYYRRYLEVAPNAPNAAFVRAMLKPRTR